MKTLLTPEETILAKSQGWCLEYVFDTTKNKWMLRTLPLEIKGNVQMVTELVMSLAKQRNMLCIKALQLIHQHNMKI